MVSGGRGLEGRLVAGRGAGRSPAAAVAGGCRSACGGGRGGPRVVGCLTAAEAATAAALGLDHLRRRELQARPDLVDVDLVGRALLALLGLPLALLEPPLHDHAHAAL